MKQDNEKLLQLMRERFSECVSAEIDIRNEAEKDLLFVAGDQWNPVARKERKDADKPCLTFNKLPTFVQQVVNAARQKKPSIKVSPVDSQTDKDTAKVYNGIVRHIEYASDADVAYDTALEYAVTCGFGYYRILTDYCGDDESFDQEIKIEAIADPFSVYIDPAARKHDRSDMRYAFVVDRISRDEFHSLYKDADGNGFDLDSYGVSDWIEDSTIRVAEYWWIEEKPKTIALVEVPIQGVGGVSGVQLATLEAKDVPKGAKVVKKRTVQKRTVRCIKTNGFEVLEEKEWAGSWIPIVPVFGKELYVQGKRYLFSLVRFARDPQQLYNFYRTSEAETVSMGAKAPWVGYEGQFKDSRWDTAHSKNWAYLEVAPVMVNGAPAPLPVRNSFEPPIQALSVGATQASDDIKASLGMFDAAIGAQSNETSGIAIQRRQAESDVSNFHFSDNQARSQRHAGRILVELIPVIYDTEREVRIIGEDERERVVTVNAAYVDPETGKPHEYKLNAGKYDVTVKTGPSYSTQRQEAFDLMTQFAQAYPQLLQIAGDVIFANADVPGAEAIAERFKKTLPPELASDDDGQKQLPPAVMKRMQQSGQMIEMLTAKVNELEDEREKKAPELELKRDIEFEKLRIQREDMQLRYGLEMYKAGSREAEIELVKTLELGMHRDKMLDQQQARADAQAATEAAAAQAQQNSIPEDADPGLAAAA
jgi:hypothetical protein